MFSLCRRQGIYKALGQVVCSILHILHSIFRKPSQKVVLGSTNIIKLLSGLTNGSHHPLSQPSCHTPCTQGCSHLRLLSYSFSSSGCHPGYFPSVLNSEGSPSLTMFQENESLLGWVMESFHKKIYVSPCCKGTNPAFRERFYE